MGRKLGYWTSRVFRITCSDDRVAKFGTGFACWQEGEEVFVVTCWHVIREIGSKYLRLETGDSRSKITSEQLREKVNSYLRINNAKNATYELVSDPGDDGLDLAVLRVKNLTAACALKMAAVGNCEMKFLTFGYEPDGRPLSGKLGEAISKHSEGKNKDIPAWDYYLKDKRRSLERVEPGYSGAPVIKWGHVVAVISIIEGDDKGSAIDISNIKDVYPDAARFFDGRWDRIRNLLDHFCQEVAQELAGAGRWFVLSIALLPVMAVSFYYLPASIFQTEVVVETSRNPLRHTLTAEELAEFKPPTASPLPAQQPLRDTLKSGGFGPEMVSLTGGPFEMGSPTTEPERNNDEGPPHTVTVPAFALSRTEVSFADYDRFAEATGRRKPADRWGRGNQPVINVSWNDAQAYAGWLSEQTGRKYRLPSEAEWEYAARAGITKPFWTGDCIRTDQVNYDGNYDYNNCGAKTGVYREKTVEVGSLPANAWGLHETAGNVWEWTADCWHDNYAGAPTDGSAWREGNGRDCARRVLRGGSWDDGPQFLRSATRNRFPADVANDVVGIRLARTP